jgi:hypothetical protein
VAAVEQKKLGSSASKLAALRKKAVDVAAGA